MRRKHGVLWLAFAAIPGAFCLLFLGGAAYFRSDVGASLFAAFGMALIASLPLLKAYAAFRR